MVASLVYIQHVETGFVLDIKESNTDPGAEVIAYPYYTTPNQHWEIQDGYIISELSGLVLSVDEETGKIITSEKVGGPSQQWVVDDSGIISNGTGKVLEIIVPENEDDAAQLVAAENHGGPSQIFKSVAVE